LQDTPNYRNVAPQWWNRHGPCCGGMRETDPDGTSKDLRGRPRDRSKGLMPENTPESHTSLIPSACFIEGASIATLKRKTRTGEPVKLVEILGRTRPVGQWN
jgi:hypothetical protein